MYSPLTVCVLLTYLQVITSKHEDSKEHSSEHRGVFFDRFSYNHPKYNSEEEGENFKPLSTGWKVGPTYKPYEYLKNLREQDEKYFSKFHADDSNESDGSYGKHDSSEHEHDSHEHDAHRPYKSHSEHDKSTDDKDKWSDVKVKDAHDAHEQKDDVALPKVKPKKHKFTPRYSYQIHSNHKPYYAKNDDSESKSEEEAWKPSKEDKHDEYASIEENGGYPLSLPISYKTKPHYWREKGAEEWKDYEDKSYPVVTDKQKHQDAFGSQDDNQWHDDERLKRDKEHWIEQAKPKEVVEFPEGQKHGTEGSSEDIKYYNEKHQDEKWEDDPNPYKKVYEVDSENYDPNYINNNNYIPGYHKYNHLPSYPPPKYKLGGHSYGWVYKPVQDFHKKYRQEQDMNMLLLAQHEKKLREMQMKHLAKYRDVLFYKPFYGRKGKHMGYKLPWQNIWYTKAMNHPLNIFSRHVSPMFSRRRYRKYPAYYQHHLPWHLGYKYGGSGNYRKDHSEKTKYKQDKSEEQLSEQNNLHHHHAEQNASIHPRSHYRGYVGHSTYKPLKKTKVVEHTDY